MQYGISNLGIVPLRLEPSETCEMKSQVLYGEHFKILDQRAKWSKIRIAFDACEGWIRNNQYLKISEQDYSRLDSEETQLSADLIEYITDEQNRLMPVPIGSALNFSSMLNHRHEGQHVSGKRAKENLLNTAFLYLNAPFLWGGKTPFGIDASGFTQMVYRLNGYKLFRSAAEQARQGDSLSFIEESEPGDLAFFDNPEGVIDHVGIMMSDNYIIHADGKVRLDRIDHSGIYNAELRKHTHQLRVIKRIF